MFDISYCVLLPLVFNDIILTEQTRTNIQKEAGSFFVFILCSTFQAEELFSRPDVQAEEALVVVSELAAASTPAATSQLPRDITTTSDILANTVDLLLQTTNNISDGHRNTVNISEVSSVYNVIW